MRRFLVELQFNGRKYGGWQKNDNALTVQSVVEEALFKLFGEKIAAEGCSRTDAGVSAEKYFFHFDADTALPAERVCYKLDRFLPGDVQAQSSVETDARFHARRDAVCKTYIYRFYEGEHIKPLLNRDAYYAGTRLCEENMRRACEIMSGKHDFSAFRTPSSSHSSPVKTVRAAYIVKQEDLYSFVVTADGFLYNMARIMAGAAVAAGQGKVTPGEIAEALETGVRPGKIITLPPKGLVLKDVEYGDKREKFAAARKPVDKKSNG